MNIRHVATAVVSALALLVASCGGGSGDSPTETGTLRLKITDGPACGFDAVNVTVEKVRVHQVTTAADDAPGWSEVVLNPKKRINLLDLTNGVLADLGQLPLPAGTYTQLRLVLGQDDGNEPLENSVVPTDGSEIALNTPSALQSGLKMKVNVEVPANKVVDLVIDVDACKSVQVTKRGGMIQYNLRPVVRVIPQLVDAGQGVIGYVDSAIAYPHPTQVSLQKNGEPVKSTFADGDGRFFLYPVPPDPGYDLVITSEGRVTAVMTGVPVDTTDYTVVSTEAARISPPQQSTMGTAIASGLVTVDGAEANTGGEVRASQSLTDGPAVEVGYSAADADTGEYGLTLPKDKPVKVAYTAGATTFAFSGTDADAGKYTLEAFAPGTTPLPTVDINLTGSDVTTNFDFQLVP